MRRTVEKRTVEPTLKQKLYVQLRSIVRAMDVFPVLRINGVISMARKLIHAGIGLVLMVVLQLTPFFGFLNIKLNVTRNFLLGSNSVKNFTSIARNACIVSPFLTNMIMKYFGVSHKDKSQKKVFERGLRNCFVLVGCFIKNVYQLIHRQLDQVVILLYPASYLPYLVCLNCVQTFVVSLASLWLEQYISAAAFSGQNVIIYYQFTDLFIHIYLNPVPGVFTWTSVFIGYVLILNMTLIDTRYTETINLTHVHTSSIKQKITYVPSNVHSNISFIYNLFKSAVYNTGDLIINPLSGYLLGRQLIPKEFFRYPIFAQNYYLICFTYRSYRSYPFLHLVLSLMIDQLANVLLIHNIGVFIPELSIKQLQTQLTTARLKVANTNTTIAQLEQLKLHQRKFLRFNNLYYFVFSTVLSIVPIYGGVIRGSTLYYYYGKVNQIFLELMKLKVKDTPPVVARLRKYYLDDSK